MKCHLAYFDVVINPVPEIEHNGYWDEDYYCKRIDNDKGVHIVVVQVLFHVGNALELVVLEGALSEKQHQTEHLQVEKENHKQSQLIIELDNTIDSITHIQQEDIEETWGYGVHHAEPQVLPEGLIVPRFVAAVFWALSPKFRSICCIHILVFWYIYRKD